MTTAMTRNERAQKSGDNARNRSHGKSQNSKLTKKQLKAIYKIKRALRSEHTIKASFKDSKGNEIKELVYTFGDSDPLELLIEFEKQLIKLGDRYDLFDNGRWEVLCQIGGRALQGRYAKYWKDIVEGVCNNNAGDSDTPQEI